MRSIKRRSSELDVVPVAGDVEVVVIFGGETVRDARLGAVGVLAVREAATADDIA
jgi:hypothetical protein